MKVAVIGGSGGIGEALVRQLGDRHDVAQVHATYRRQHPILRNPKIDWQALDVTDDAAIADWSQQVGELDWLINAVGILHDENHGPEKTIRRIDPEFFLDNLRINTLPTLLLARHLQGSFRHGRPAVFATVSARVGSITDNRLGGWYSYRASKAALNMCLKTLAIEWQRSLPNVTVAALHPGTTATALSEPFQNNVPPHKLFSPMQAAGYLLKVLQRLSPGDSGKFWAYDGEELPW